MKQATYLTTAGGKLPFSFGMNALSSFLDSEGLALADLGELGANMKISTALNIVFYGFADGHRREGVPFTLTPADIGDLIDDNPELLAQAMDVFANSMPKFANDPEPGNVQPRRMKART